jgi:hypothetical protein
MSFWNRHETVEDHVLHPWAGIALLIAAAALALGTWALTATGVPTHDLFAPDKSILGLHHTPALAIGEIVFGVVMLFAGLSPLLGRAFMAVLGLFAAAFGVIVLASAWPDQLRHWTAARDSNGWVFLAVGVVAFAASTLMPTVSTRRVVKERTAQEHHHWWPRGHAPA